jgi:predicted DNA-binding transcriptional regulator AlpA
MKTQHDNPHRLMRLSQIIGPDGILPFSRSTFYAKVKAGEIPQPIKLGARISAWRASDIYAVIEHAQNGGVK